MPQDNATVMTPRLLGVKDAAAYCGLSPNAFEAHVPIEPLRFGKRKLWDRVSLDRYLDARAGKTNHAPSLAERAGLWGKSA
jgi:hypothetical protein